MKSKQLKFGLVGFSIVSIFGLTACDKDDDHADDPHHDHEEELITTVKLTFTDSVTSAQSVFQFQDIDGPGGNDPDVFDTIQLSANSTYLVEVKFLNESESPSEDITEEVLEEDDEHIVCYSTASDVTVERTDTDGNYEVGLSSKWKTNAAEESTLTLTLKHQPDVKDGTCLPGETDVEVTFPLAVK